MLFAVLHYIELCFLQAAPVDPLDALASSLPAPDPVAPSKPSFTGPEVKEVTRRLSLVFVCESLCRKNNSVLHGFGVFNVCCMCPSMTSHLRKVTSVEYLTARCLQATDLKMWSVCHTLCFPFSLRFSRACCFSVLVSF